MGNTGRILALDAMRGIAALLVLGFHLHTVFGGFGLFSRSYLAVDFFFMLSGFVMARTYEPKFAEGLGPLQFFKLRFFRLWPPMAAGAAIGAVLFLTSFSLPVPLVAGGLLASLLFVPIAGTDPFPLNRPTWSITFELLANLLHGLLLWRLRSRWLLLVAVISLAALVVLCLPLDHILVGNKGDRLFGGVPRVLLAYAIGIVLCRRGRVLPGPAWAALPLLAAALLFIPAGLTFDLVFVVLACPALILLGVRASGGRLAAILGGLSFPLYAVHYPVLQFGRIFGFDPFVTAALALVISLFVAFAVDRRLLRKRVEGGRAVEHVELGNTRGKCVTVRQGNIKE
ncbi:acyltransferase family protein [Aurantiacibacter gilvus]|uniref:Acyltransferase n=1 Tax=Aurantiacibacter gilvus TaxID=3139141 RepID=A0ABU9IF38_9SPHN